MKTQPRYTKESLRTQLVMAANRIISDSYDIELLAWDAENTRKAREERLRNDMMNDVVAVGPPHDVLFVFTDPPQRKGKLEEFLWNYLPDSLVETIVIAVIWGLAIWVLMAVFA
ncbi:MAG: hypothetical protein M3Q13_09965 [Pseudomonadota bacterium]|nr:hypothetical protein [Pseudomonadota bacterium]